MKFKPDTFRPAADRRVRHPDGRVFDAGGETVPASAYYRRLVRDGDLEPVPAETKPVAKGRQTS